MNSKEITGSSNYVGGLVSIANQCSLKIADSLNVGVVKRTSSNTTNYYGAIVGGLNGSSSAKGNMTFEKVYYLDSVSTKSYQINTNNASHITISSDEIYSKTMNEISDTTTPINLDFTTNWTRDAQSMPIPVLTNTH